MDNRLLILLAFLTHACGCPLYWKGPLFCSAGGERTGSVSVHKFVAMWRKILQNCHDDAAKFVHLLMNPGCNYLVQEDFVPFLQLEEEADINQLTEYFSYEHFYVIYCKFWELDTDHDLLIDSQDLARHNDHALSTKMIERIFSGAVTRGRKVQKEGKISYADFVWFLISEEDKKTPTRYAFRRCRAVCWPFVQMGHPDQGSRHPSRPNAEFRQVALAPTARGHGHFAEGLPQLGPRGGSWGPPASAAPQHTHESLLCRYEAELSPVDQKLSVLRSPLAQRPFFEAPSALGTVDLYEYACDDADLQPS
ncbi:serine/threonine-protein phosphatase 2A regulatory subunit B'' subunit beta-like [Puma concolor]|uniref:Serine/threonine-protein phosphatase 2A regulatory subunit B'' subunit beta-like n=1 Tax=Puma concolor TaxID=9696 RepID=A0A6P6IRQ7_PUMCO|nr:serine/threonine-protein phosphatase 2A regulatory subunit B'' subunit beta-like [Puma concolor]